MARLVELAGTVPIRLTVDLDARRVIEVRVLDEEAEIDPVGPAAAGDWARAEAVAEEADWPAWEFGR